MSPLLQLHLSVVDSNLTLGALSSRTTYRTRHPTMKVTGAGQETVTAIGIVTTAAVAPLPTTLGVAIEAIGRLLASLLQVSTSLGQRTISR